MIRKVGIALSFVRLEACEVIRQAIHLGVKLLEA
jgi:hypothetical protein